MGRLVAIVVITVLVVWLLRRALARPEMPARGEGAGAAGGADRQALVRCAHCGVNLPGSEAVLAGDRVYCSEEHSRLGQRGG